MEALQLRSLALDAGNSLRRVLEPEVLSGLLVAAILVPLAARDGGFSPVSWGWTGIGLAWIGLIALLVRGEILITRLDMAWMAGWLALTAWTALGLVWTQDTTSTALDVERTLVYLVAGWVLVVSARSRSGMGLLFGTWGAITIVCAYGLATHLLPLRFGIYDDPTQPGRLYQPLGYWNGLGIFACMGALLAAGIADRRGHVVGRLLAAASLPTLVLTMYFTFSRGAWAAALPAIAVVVLVAAHRLRYLLTVGVLAVFTGIPLIVSGRSTALTASTLNASAAEHAGAGVLVILAAASVACVLAVLGLALAQDRISTPVWARRAFAGTLVCAAIAAVGIGTARYGSPATIVHRVDHALGAPPPAANTANLTNRLFSLSLNGRGDLWRTSLHEFHEHPAVGSGAGTFSVYWFQRRPYALFVEDAHSLYLEAAGELGAVGLTLLIAVLSIPLIAGIRGRHHQAVPAALGAYAAFVVHASFDWDWELPAVTVVALISGATLLIAARGDPRLSLGRVTPWLLSAAFVAIGGLALGGLLSNTAISDAQTALRAGQWKTALDDAKKAEHYAPWSEEPYLIAGSAEQGLGNRPAAAAEFRKATAKSPSDWDAWNSLAATATGQQRVAAVRMARLLNPLSATSAGSS